MFKYPVKDFNHWHTLITSAKAVPILKSIGEDLNQFQKQTDLIGGDPKLNDGQMASLRGIYAVKLKKLTEDSLNQNKAGRTQFNK